ncbi:N(4)-(Beta-N-acetylglucosaminyl)-L-asparaginase-like [Ptychodera flava]|uniref:N(4)-(Beta-N-acetylglucosaminyl)-L-asparaginase- like n=1 Tax=Ptychodera flava TaxID=63121 RepID=UPI00396A44B4
MDSLGVFLLIFTTFSGNPMSLSLADDVPVVLVTWDFPEATQEAWDTITGDGSAVDAAEKACNFCELEPSLCRFSVGYGNRIDDTGEPTLDAMIMDGITHDVGAVGGIRRVKKAISVARMVMEYTKHTLLVGDSASNFAHTFGDFEDESLKTNKTRVNYDNWNENNCQPNFWENVTPDPSTSCGPYTPAQPPSRETAAKIDKDNHDTIGIVVIGSDKNVACGTSTNGLNHKIAGRVGDSPIVGAGCYVDNDVGGAAATGNGDIMIRLLPSYQAVENMRRGLSAKEASAEALSRIAYKYNDFRGAIIAVNKEGDYGAECYGYTTVEITYRTGSMTNITVEEIQCTVEPKKPSVGSGNLVRPNVILCIASLYLSLKALTLKYTLPL